MTGITRIGCEGRKPTSTHTLRLRGRWTQRTLMVGLADKLSRRSTWKLRRYKGQWINVTSGKMVGGLAKVCDLEAITDINDETNSGSRWWQAPAMSTHEVNEMAKIDLNPKALHDYIQVHSHGIVSPQHAKESCQHSNYKLND